MTSDLPYQRHLRKSEALVTTQDARRKGFVAAAIEKSRLAGSFLEEARILKVKASRIRKPRSLLQDKDLRWGLLTAAGISEKAATHVVESDILAILDEFITNFLEPAGKAFLEELVFRFLLTRGDTLGGKIRNLAGAWAQARVSRCLASILRLEGRSFRWLHPHRNLWCKPEEEGAEFARGFSWKCSEEERILLYNVKIPLIKKQGEKAKAGKNVDVCFLRASSKEFQAEKATLLQEAGRYLALGELKGGIDPAGADEHWKTAHTSLSRIRQAFANAEGSLPPALFFVGSAIEASMAIEIWEMLQKGELTNAANLNEDEQIISLVMWLCHL